MVIAGVAWLWGVCLILITVAGIYAAIALFRLAKSSDDRERAGLVKGLIRLFKKSDELTSEQKRSVKIQRVGLLSTAVVAVLAIFVVIFAATSAPQFCNFCHAMKADYVAWEASPHAQVTCFACHLKPGVVNYVEGHVVDAVKSAAAWVTGNYEEQINLESKLSDELHSEGCKTCHSIDKRKVTPSAGVIINHKAHTDRNIGCAVCHNRVGHVNMKGYVEAISMEGCTRCHGFAKTDKATGECKACHPKGFELVPADHKAVNWKSHEHSALAKKVAEKVKVATKKAEAEGESEKKEESESKPPLPLHNGKSSCVQCHDEQKFCSGCHQMAMPHPSNFTNASIHGKLGTEKPQVCANCHAKQGQTQNFCSGCHHKGFDPNIAWAAAKGVPQAHPGIVKKSGAEGCLKCHDNRYCSSCHTQGQPNMQFMYKQR